MSTSRRSLLFGTAAVLVAVVLIAVIGGLTNSIDTEMFSWDFRYYADMAETGLRGRLASPFAYRYLTPLLAGTLSRALALSTEAGFTVIASVSAAIQLASVYLFTRWMTRSELGAWMAMLVISFSLFNIKFLLFDVFRPDHLAFPLIFLQAYFALRRRYTPLLLASIVGSQIREFAFIPLIAYHFAELTSASTRGPQERGRRKWFELTASAFGLSLAILLPRLLIPVAEDFQFFSLTRDGILRALLAPFILPRDANFLYCLVAYMLPVLMLSGPVGAGRALRMLEPRARAFLGAYSLLVLALSFLGGTDFFRFAAYLALPAATVIGLVSDRVPVWRLGLVLGGVFLFNRVWLPFPMTDRDAYLDFYGGHGTRFNSASMMRAGELLVLIAVGEVARRIRWHQEGPAAPQA